MLTTRQGGQAANAFGSVEQASNNSPPLSLDAEHNILAAIVRWVEEGVAPDTLTGVYYHDNDVANGVGFTRPLCRVRIRLLTELNDVTEGLCSTPTTCDTSAETLIVPKASSVHSIRLELPVGLQLVTR